ncbi:exodeoxyribonuclease VII large subunit [Colwellia sp. 6M3]|jgi:exodeoxyribonuclease VII large subunit|uniref:exodeoxyribonuclease VII large subunit n=1 Tax=Colwellia sp. 6M3 TaxID=2759849 RepID=UPI0015F76A3A|nr:exodeoxyribonuclease VII large subunit [Colwellia sp. 6M3]MBA6414790.1 exodeoxyribonuclease VII large subunit [Colwellia sp. 6M3]|tara:strand:- start:3404 stop:4741 length:1338 start_codon:yes stop_codon:yes gene_type:complete
MAQQHILQVSELTKKVRFILESELNTVWLCGEISNFIAASSGHWYLSLKDQKSQVRCAMFKGNNRKVRIQPQNGQQVLVRAKVSLYEPRGDFQLIIEQMESAGEGLLRQQYQLLKDKLHSEGLFELHYKQVIPKLIQTVGIITSPTGAAVKDIITVLNRRNPLLKVIIYPVLVQGEQAKYDIAQAIALANQRNEVDVLLITRGGGSLEDLWAFNEEIVARAIFQSRLPTISGVGHEIDTTLSDYVADLRAPTPSAAAELVSADVDERINSVKALLSRAQLAIKQQIQRSRFSVVNLNHRLSQVHPEHQLQNKQQKSDELTLRLQGFISRKLNQVKHQPGYLQQRLLNASPANKIKRNLLYCEQLKTQLSIAQQRLLMLKRESFAHQCEQLHIVSPLATIARGYSITRTEQGEMIKSIKDITIENNIKVEVSDGVIEAKVIAVKAS